MNNLRTTRVAAVAIAMAVVLIGGMAWSGTSIASMIGNDDGGKMLAPQGNNGQGQDSSEHGKPTNAAEPAQGQGQGNGQGRGNNPQPPDQAQDNGAAGQGQGQEQADTAQEGEGQDHAAQGQEQADAAQESGNQGNAAQGQGAGATGQNPGQGQGATDQNQEGQEQDDGSDNTGEEGAQVASPAPVQPATPASPAEKVNICHMTESETNPSTFITVGENAVAAHEAHGDIVGVDSADDCESGATPAAATPATPVEGT